MRVVVACLALAACGRWNFDPLQDDAATGHDEDGDGIVDADDPCPHVAGDRTDEDADGVGDACDPVLNDPRQRYLLFATLMPGDQPFVDVGLLGQEADALRCRDSLGLVIARSIAGTVRVDLGFDIDAVIGTGQHQVGGGVERGAEPYYFVELDDDGDNKTVAVASYDAVNGYVTIGAVPHPGIHPGRGHLRYDATAGTSPGLNVEAGWEGELYGTQGSTPAYAGGTSLRFALNGLDIALRYVAVIESF